MTTGIGRAELRDTALTLAIAGAGALLFWLIGFPAPVLTGPAAAVTAASLVGVPTGIPDLVRNVCFLALGMSIGATITPEVIRTAALWPATLAVLFATLVAGLVINRRALGRLFSYDRETAFLASVPGHMSYVFALSQNLQVDQARIGIVQALRVLVMTLAVPFLLGLTIETEGAAPQPDTMSLMAGLATLAASIALGALFLRLNLPAALLLAGMAASGFAHATGLVSGGMPIWAVTFAFLVLGALIGTRFRGRSPSELGNAAVASVVVTSVVLAVAAVAALLCSRLLGLSPATLFVAFAPGGLEAMIAMSVQLDLDPAFVAAHHVVRLLILTVLVPVMLR